MYLLYFLFIMYYTRLYFKNNKLFNYFSNKIYPKTRKCRINKKCIGKDNESKVCSIRATTNCLQGKEENR